MTYQPREWKDRLVERPRTYEIVENPDGTVTLIPRPGQVLEEGTPVNAGVMNALEAGLVAISETEPPNLKVGQLWLKILN